MGCSRAEKVVEKILVTAGKGVEWVLDRVLPDDSADDAVAERLADDQAAALMLEVSEDELRLLRGQWAEGVENLAGTQAFVDDTMRRLYLAWEAGFGAAWFTAELGQRLTRVLDDLINLRDVLNVEAPFRDTVVSALGGLENDLDVAKTQLRADLAGRHEPFATPNGQDGADERARFVNSLDYQIKRAEHSLKIAKLNRTAAATPRGLGSRTKEEAAAAVAQAQAEVDALTRELHKLKTARGLF
jgi:hypothetical protein